MVEIPKTILTKEKLDRQLTRQSMSTPFMSIRDGHYRKVSFDSREEVGVKIDKLAVMIGKLETRNGGTNRQFNPKSIRVEVEVKTEITIRETSIVGTDQIEDQTAETEDNTDKLEVSLDIKNIEEVILEEMSGAMVDKTVEENIETAIEITVMTETGNRERSFSRNYDNNRIRSTSNSRSRSVSRASTNKDRICCY